MKTYLSLFLSAILIGIVILFAAFGGNDELKSSGGAPPGYTNSPGDGQNCSHCMGGSAVAVNNWITSDIPATGYVPGETYNITVTATGTGNKGFEASPQDLSGNLLGTLIAGTGNKLVGSGKYVTHTSASSANPKTWTFQWTAPASGSGEVVFYGSIAVGKTNTKTTTLSVTQSTVGIGENDLTRLSVFPNPSKETFSVSFTLPHPARVHLDLVTSRGDVAMTLLDETIPEGKNTRTFTIEKPAGLYYLRMNYGGKDQQRKIILQ